MFDRRTDAEWEKFGQTDPYYGVLSQDRFHRGKLDAEAIQAFFQSGSDHIHYILDRIRCHLDPAFDPRRSLDFGCGVGRCLVPLSSLSRSVLGLDVSQAMLDEARKVLAERKIENVELLLSDDAISRASGTFDFIHSILVFQHIRPHRGVKLFEKLVKLLSDGGVGAVQFPYRRDVSFPVRAMGACRKHVPLFHNAVNLLYGKPLNEPLMEKNCYDLNTLFAVLQHNRCGRLHVEFQGRGNLLNVILLFQRDEDWIAYEPFSEEN